VSRRLMVATIKLAREAAGPALLHYGDAVLLARQMSCRQGPLEGEMV
jgi:hypothetical protein